MSGIKLLCFSYLITGYEAERDGCTVENPKPKGQASVLYFAILTPAMPHLVT